MRSKTWLWAAAVVLGIVGAGRADDTLLYRLTLDSADEAVNGVTKKGSPIIQEGGKFGSCYKVDSVNGGSVCATGYAIDNIQTENAKWSVSFWFNPNGLGNWRDVLSFGIGNTRGKLEKTSNNELYLYQVGSASAINSGARFVSYASGWNHIVMVGTETGFDVYLNGSKNASVTAAEPAGLTDFHVGNCGDSGMRQSTALIDEVAIFNFALREDQIVTLGTKKANELKLNLYNTTVSNDMTWADVLSAANLTDNVDIASESLKLVVDAETTPTLTFEEAYAALPILIIEGNVNFAKAEDVELTIPAYDLISVKGCATVNFSTGEASVRAGSDTVLTQLGTGAITVESGKKVTLKGAAAKWAADSITVKAGGKLVLAGTRDDFPWVSAAAKIAGEVVYAYAYTTTGAGGVQFGGSLTRGFAEGADIKTPRFVVGNEGSSVQTFNHTGGSITATGTGDITSADGTGYSKSSVLIAHWPSTVTYNLTGGSLTATEGTHGSIYLARDGNAKVYVGGGTGTATLKTNGLVDDWRGTQSHDGTLIEVRPNGVFDLGPNGVDMRTSGATLTLKGGTLSAYDTASVKVTHASGVQLAEGTTSVLAAAAEKTLTVTSKLTGAGNLKIGDENHTGTVKLTSADTTASGTFTVAAGATLEVPASTDATTYTIAAPEGAAVKLVLSETQKAATSAFTLGNKFAGGFAGTVTAVGADGEAVEHVKAEVANGVATVTPETRSELTWDGTDWKNAKGEAATPTENDILVLKANDEVTLDDETKAFAVTMPEDGLVTIRHAGRLAVTAIAIPENATLRLDIPETDEIADTEVLKSSLRLVGAGRVELYCSSSEGNPFVTRLPLVNDNLSDDFTGRVKIGRGRFTVGTPIKDAVGIEVVHGGSLYVTGGTWNNHFYLSGEGCLENGSAWDIVPLRLESGSIGANGVLEFLTVDGKKPGLGCLNSQTSQIAGRVIAAQGFRVTTGNFVFTAPTTQVAGVAGTVDLQGGTVTFGQGQYLVDSYKFGDTVRINSGAQLNWQTRTNTSKDASESDKGAINTAFELNGGTLHLEDGSYVFNQDITVLAASTLSVKWAKGRIFKSLKGKAGVTLTYKSENNDQSQSYNYFTGGNFAGTLAVTGTGQDAWIVPGRAALENATVNLGGKSYLCLTGDATLGALTGETAVFGDGSPRTLRLKGGTYAGAIKDQANGTSDETKALSLSVAGNVTLTGDLTYSGSTVLENDGKLTVSRARDNVSVAQEGGCVLKTVENEGSVTYLAAVPVTGESKEIAATSEEEALEKAVFRPAKEGQAEVVTLRAVETATGSGQWTVTAEIDAEKMAKGHKIDDTLTAFATAGGLKAATGADPASGNLTVEIPLAKMTKGLYYSLVMSTTVDFGTKVEGRRVLAQGNEDGNVTLTIPRKTNGSVHFFKMAASLEDNLK